MLASARAQALVKDLLPLVGLAIPGLGNLATWRIPIPETTLDASGNPPAGYTGQIFGLGEFLVALITFVIVAFVIFLVVKVSRKWGMEYCYCSVRMRLKGGMRVAGVCRWLVVISSFFALLFFRPMRIKWAHPQEGYRAIFKSFQ